MVELEKTLSASSRKTTVSDSFMAKNDAFRTDGVLEDRRGLLSTSTVGNMEYRHLWGRNLCVIVGGGSTGCS